MDSETEKTCLDEEKEHLLSASSQQQEKEHHQGVRPKVRSVDEPCRKSKIPARRERSYSHGSLPDLKNTGDDPQKKPLPSKKKKKASVAKGSGKKAGGFGVKSYLHNFYESVSIKNPYQFEEFDEGNFHYLIKPSRRRRRRLCWKVSLWSGILTLLLGLSILLVGHLVGRHQVVVGQQEEMTIIDHAALHFNRNLELCKVVGLILFCAGGIITVAALMFYGVCCDDEQVFSEPFLVSFSGADELPPKSPTDSKVPVTEALESIQPKSEDNEDVVMTNSGLFKIPSS